MTRIDPVPTLEAPTVEFLREADGTLTLLSEGRKWTGVRVVLCAPLSDPDALASVQSDGKELAMLRGLSRLPPASRKALESVLLEQYLTPRITKVRSLDYQFGAVYWNVETDHGPREFVMKGLSQHVRWLSDTRLILTDVDSNRFEVADLEALDEESRDWIGLVL